MTKTYSDRSHILVGLVLLGFTVTGLMGLAPDIFRRSASYVDRILKGEKPADLPAQAPSIYNFVINLHAAKTLGIELPPTLLSLADEVIK